MCAGCVVMLSATFILQVEMQYHRQSMEQVNETARWPLHEPPSINLVHGCGWIGIEPQRISSFAVAKRDHRSPLPHVYVTLP